MALAQLVIQAPGGLIKSGDWNNEFQNILTHPIALISPSTGAINFNLQAHTGLIPGAITATSASAGQALMSTGGAAVSFQNVISTASVPLAGSTGQVLAITSSSTGPSFQVLPIDGGLSTTIPTGGMIYFVGTSAAFLRGLTIGTSGQVLTVTTSGTPGWAAASASGSGASNVPSTSADITFFDDFVQVFTSVGAYSSVGFVRSTAKLEVGDGSAFWAIPSGRWTIADPAGRVSASNQNFERGGVLAFYSTTAAGTGYILNADYSSQWLSTNHFSVTMRIAANSTGSGSALAGLTNTVFNTTSPVGFYIINEPPANIFFVGLTSSGGRAQIDTGITNAQSSAFHTYVFGVTSSKTTLSVDGGADLGTLSTAALTFLPLNFGFGGLNLATSQGWACDFFNVQTTAAVRL